MTKGVIYLDNAATSWPKPEAVYRAVDIAMREHGANPGRGSHRMSVDAQRIVDETRQEICRLPTSGERITGMRLCSSAQSSLGSVVTIAKLGTRSPPARGQNRRTKARCAIAALAS